MSYLRVSVRYESDGVYCLGVYVISRRDVISIRTSKIREWWYVLSRRVCKIRNDVISIRTCKRREWCVLCLGVYVRSRGVMYFYMDI